MSPRTHRPEPQKPTPPLGKILFSKNGTVNLVVETLPTTKNEVELAIMTKYRGALSRTVGRIISPPVRGAEPDDFVTVEQGEQVGVQLVEVIDPIHGRKRETQRWYAGHVREAIRGLMLPDDLSIQLDDGYQSPDYPRPRTPAATALVREIARLIEDVAADVGKLPPGQVLAYRWRDHHSGPKIGASFIRAHRTAQDGPAVRYLGSFSTTTAHLDSLLPATIERKLKKRYAPSSGKFWLLTYSLDHPHAGGVEPARQLVQQLGAQPFHEIWYFHPYANEDLGHVEQIHPLPSGTAAHPTPKVE